MKKTITLFLLLSIVGGTLKSQVSEMLTQLAAENINYRMIVEHMDSLIQNTPGIDTLDASGIKAYQRWRWYWEDRSYGGDSTDGSFGLEAKAIESTDFSFPTKKSAGWVSLGPDRDIIRAQTGHIEQRSGLINCVKPSPYWGFNPIIGYPLPPDSTIYAGSSTGGLYSSSPGYNWSRLTDNIIEPGLGIMDIAFIPNDSTSYNTYIATGKDRYDNPRYGGGIYKMGLYWVRIDTFSGPNTPLTYKLLTDTFGGQKIIYSATGSKVYRTLNEGGSWTEIFSLPNANGRVILDMEQKPDDPNTIYILSSGAKGSSTYRPQMYYTTQARSASGNSNWYNIFLNNAFAIKLSMDVSKAEPQSIWLLFADSTKHTTVMKKSNINAPWDTLVRKYASNYYVYKLGGVGMWRCELQVSDLYPDTFFVGGYYVDRVIVNDTNDSIDIYKFSEHFINHDEYFHVDVRSLTCFLDKNGKETLFAGNDGGVSVSFDYGTTWKNYNKNGFTIGQFYGLDGMESDADYFVGGTIDNSTFFGNKDDLKLYRRGDTYDAVYLHNSNNSCIASIFYDNIKDFSTQKQYPACSPFIFYNNTTVSFIGDFYYDTISTNNLISAAKEVSSIDRPILKDPYSKGNVLIGYRNIYKMVINNQYTDFTFELAYNLSAFDSTMNRIEAFEFAPSNKNILIVALNGATWSKPTQRRLLKSTDNGQSWTDISLNLTAVETKGITDVAISPYDPNKIWVTFGGYGNNYTNMNRVNYSEDGGLTWRDYSTGLTTFPVNRIVSVLGSPTNELYIATDVGVYYSSDVDTVWKRLGSINDFPLAIVTDLDINYTYGKLNITTFGHGIWQTDIPTSCGTNGQQEIDTNTIWFNEVMFSGNITIDSGATLTIKSTLFMDEASSITIKKGGKLIVDGGHITSRCGMWQGIIVEGDPGLSQFPLSNQGVFRMQNGATIENAIIAVRTLSPPVSQTSIYNPQGGGIIRIDNANFINNQYGILMEPYLDQNSNGFIRPNLSYVKNSKFKTNAELLDTTRYPVAFIQLNKVHKLNILSCKFENSLPTTAQNYLNKGKGIYSYNSSFTLGNAVNGDTSSFNNLSCGIYATNSLSSATFVARNANFVDNFRGIEMLAVNGATIINNNISMPTSPSSNAIPAGVMLNQCHSGYKIEGNSFAGDSTAVGMNVGLVIDNSGPQTNFVYRNTFSNSIVNAIAQGNNKSVPPVYDGLQYRCNTFNASPNTLAITHTQPNEGIAYYQGFYKSIPGLSIVQLTNNFFNNINTSNVSQIFNQGDGFKYIYHFDQPLPPDSNQVSSNVYLDKRYLQYDTNGCPTTITSASGTNGWQTNATAYKQNAQTTATVISQLVDGGDTDNMLWNIESSEPGEAYDLMVELMGESPYLSEEVLIETAQNEDVLNAAMVTQVMTANPQASRSDVVWDALISRQNNPLAQYMLDAIAANINVSSPKEELENELAFYQSQYQWYFDEINRSLLQDTLEWTSDSLAIFYRHEATPEADFLLLNHSISMGDWENAQNILDSIQLKYNLDDALIIRYDQAISFFNILIDIQADSLNELDEEDKNSLRNIAIDEQNAYRMAAQSLVNVFDDTTYFGEIYLPDESTQRRGRPKSSMDNIKKENLLKVYPNPAKDYITVEFEFGDIINSAELAIINQQGKLMQTYNITKNANYMVIQTSGYSPGIYHIVLRNNSSIVKTSTVSIITK